MLLVAYGVLSQIIEGGFYEAHENSLLFLISGVAYFSLSVVGWVLLGIPTHFAVCRWLSPKYQYYFMMCLLISVFLVVARGGSSSMIFVIAIFFQAGLFRYYVFKPKT